MKLKANAAAELTRIAESDIIPILRRQKGFRDATIFIAPERGEAIANSFWDTQEDAEAFSRTGYPEVLRVLANAIEGIPTVRTLTSRALRATGLSQASCIKRGCVMSLRIYENYHPNNRCREFTAHRR